MKILPCWKYVAKNKEGFEFLYACQPQLVGDKWVRYSCSDEKLNLFLDLPELRYPCHWTDSLHEIIDGTKLVKVRPDLNVDDKIYVREENGEWIPRHFAHWNDNSVAVYVNGKTSFTTRNTCFFMEWRLPYEKGK